jgi:hypothetical protein
MVDSPGASRVSARLAVVVGVVLLCAAETGAASGAPDNRYIYAPASRTVSPVAVLKTTGSVTAAQHLLGGGAARLSGQGSSVVLDFGKEVGGLVTLHFASSSDTGQQLGLAFSESSLGIGPASDASNGGPQGDGAIYASVTGPGTYTMPPSKLRGGFRYLTLFLNSPGTVDLDRVSLYVTAAPAMGNLRAYPDYFRSSDVLLNRIWYAGAYTVQMDTIAHDAGRVWPPPAGGGWDNSGLIGVGSSVLADGAKRDRTVWPGDLGISVPTDFAAFDDITTIRNTLSVLYQHQDPEGAFPYAGPEVNFPGALSDTYHLWTLIVTAEYELYSGDKSWLDGIWSQYKQGVAWSTARIDSNGLFTVVGSADWARSGQGQENIAANALMYRALVTASTLAGVEGDSALATSYAQKAAALRAAINSLLWDPAAGAYKDNQSSSLNPQDGNSLAVWFGIPDSPQKTRSILQVLKRNWTRLGAHTPEWTGIHPYPGSLEIQARLAAGDDSDALALIRREWGYMLNAPIGTASTFWEGFKDDGSFAYESTGPGYTSLAHGWATGPTSALTFYVLGLQPASAGGHYELMPHPGGLRFAEGRLRIPQGALDASWRRDGAAFQIALVAPAGTSGRVGIPVLSPGTPVYVNGSRVRVTRPTAGYAYLDGLSGGRYSISTVRPAFCTGASNVTVRIASPSRIRSARVTVNGKLARSVRISGRRLSLSIRLARVEFSSALVRVRVRPTRGRAQTYARTYYRCGV